MKFSNQTNCVLTPNASDQSKTDVSVFIAEHLTPPTGAAPTAVGSPQAETAGPVEVTLKEFTIDMPQSLPAGKTTFHVTNAGTIDHSLEIEGQGIEEKLDHNLAPGEDAMLEVDLRPGTFDAYCPVDDHRSQGMEVQLTVG